MRNVNDTLLLVHVAKHPRSHVQLGRVFFIHIDTGYSRLSGERIILKGTLSFRQNDRFDGRRGGEERHLADGQRRLQIHLAQLAVQERVVSDKVQRRRKIDSFQRGAVVERIAADIGHAFGERHMVDVLAASERRTGNETRTYIDRHFALQRGLSRNQTAVDVQDTVLVVRIVIVQRGLVERTVRYFCHRGRDIDFLHRRFHESLRFNPCQESAFRQFELLYRRIARKSIRSDDINNI